MSLNETARVLESDLRAGAKRSNKEKERTYSRTAEEVDSTLAIHLLGWRRVFNSRSLLVPGIHSRRAARYDPSLMRFTYLLLVLAILVIGGFQAWRATRPPEVKIQRKLDAFEEGFNDSVLSPCMDLFEPSFFESSEGHTFDNIKTAIISMFFREIHPVTKEFLFRVAFSEVEIDAYKETAQVSFLVELRKQQQEEWPLKWSIRFAGEMIETESDGWQFVKGSAETLEGVRPR